MEKEFLNGAIGPEAKYKVEFKEGKLCAEVAYDSKVFDAGVVLKLEADAVIDALKKAIPGYLDDTILEGIKGLLK